MESISNKLINQIVDAAQNSFQESWNPDSIQIIANDAADNILYIKFDHQNIQYLATLNLAQQNAAMHLSKLHIPYHSYRSEY